MTVTAALAGVSRLGLDTSVIICYVEHNPTFFPACNAVFREAVGLSVPVIVSPLVLTESLVKPLRFGDAALVSSYRIFLAAQGLATIPFTGNIAEIAADLRARYRIRTPDALHLATALSAGCDALPATKTCAAFRN